MRADDGSPPTFELVIAGAPDEPIRRERFTTFEITFGRVPSNDVVLATAQVSKRHARFAVQGGRCIIVDLKSSNGTFLNGRRLTAPVIVTSADRITIGQYTISFEPIAPSPPA
ncbi:MAG: FHA domain-containing protein [Myxococcota bacterium]|nr:FHA domain-containing protein [Myxococcota bacterium]